VRGDVNLNPVRCEAYKKAVFDRKVKRGNTKLSNLARLLLYDDCC
jgi:hypothetical protein